MSDKPEGPGWWIASDGRWYPPELHPSVRDDPPTPSTTGSGATTVSTWSGPDRREGDRRRAEGTDPTGAGATPGSTWSGPERREGDRRKPEGERVGPQFPDLFQKALEGSHLADTVSVRYDDERGPVPAGSNRKGGTPAASAAGGGSGSGAKRRWRKGG